MLARVAEESVANAQFTPWAPFGVSSRFFLHLSKRGWGRFRALTLCAFRNGLRAAKLDVAKKLPKRDRANKQKKLPALRTTAERRYVPQRVPKVIGNSIPWAAGGVTLPKIGKC